MHYPLFKNFPLIACFFINFVAIWDEIPSKDILAVMFCPIMRHCLEDNAIFTTQSWKYFKIFTRSERTRDTQRMIPIRHLWLLLQLALLIIDGKRSTSTFRIACAISWRFSVSRNLLRDLRRTEFERKPIVCSISGSFSLA